MPLHAHSGNTKANGANRDKRLSACPQMGFTPVRHGSPRAGKQRLQAVFVLYILAASDPVEEMTPDPVTQATEHGPH